MTNLLHFSVNTVKSRSATQCNRTRPPHMICVWYGQGTSTMRRPGTRVWLLRHTNKSINNFCVLFFKFGEEKKSSLNFVKLEFDFAFC